MSNRIRIAPQGAPTAAHLLRILIAEYNLYEQRARSAGQPVDASFLLGFITGGVNAIIHSLETR